MLPSHEATRGRRTNSCRNSSAEGILTVHGTLPTAPNMIKRWLSIWQRGLQLPSVWLVTTSPHSHHSPRGETENLHGGSTLSYMARRFLKEAWKGRKESLRNIRHACGPQGQFLGVIGPRGVGFKFHMKSTPGEFSSEQLTLFWIRFVSQSCTGLRRHQ